MENASDPTTYLTETEAMAELRRLHRKMELGGMPVLLEEATRIVFLREQDENRDYILFRVEGTGDNCRVERLVNLETGETSLTRVWLTPAEWAEWRKTHTPGKAP